MTSSTPSQAWLRHVLGCATSLQILLETRGWEGGNRVSLKRGGAIGSPPRGLSGARILSDLCSSNVAFPEALKLSGGRE